MLVWSRQVDEMTSCQSGVTFRSIGNIFEDWDLVAAACMHIWDLDDVSRRRTCHFSCASFSQ